jgi:arabinogalactan endo-1,4-beta-galactosidase
MIASGITAPLSFFDAGQALAATQPATSLKHWKKHAVLGHDLSILQQLEDAGKTFSIHGRVHRVEHIVASQGASHVRLRLWVNPPLPYNDLPHVLRMARRIRDAGMKFILDIHYSDFWADPGKQNTPAAWANQDLAMLTKTVYNYTYDVVSRLDKQGTRPDIIQIGNEVTNGMLWPLGKIYVDGDPQQHWTEFTTLLKAGIQGARDACKGSRKTRIMIHIDRGGDNGGSRYFYDKLLAYNVDFDLIGLSYYPFWHGTLSALQANLNDLSPRYQKDIVLAETAYPWTFANGDSETNSVPPGTALNTSYPASPEGQLGFMRNVISILQQVPGNRGLGVVYWEPDWIPGVGWEPGAGDGWDNMTLFDWDGKALSSIACYNF